MSKYIPDIIDTISFKDECTYSKEPIPFTEEVADNQKANTSPSMAVINTGYSAYDAKSDEYIFAAAMDGDSFDSTYDYGNDNSSINAFIVRYHHYYGDKTLAYALYDVDSNGMPELVFSDGKYIIDTYTLENNNIVKLYKDCYFGERSRLHILSDGRLLTEGSSGASSASCKVSTIGSDGISIIRMAGYYCDGNGQDPYMDEKHLYITLDAYYHLLDGLKRESVFGIMKWTTIAVN